MNKYFTQLNLIKYLYQETDDIEKILIENEIISDDNFCEEYTQLAETINLLDRRKTAPRSETLNAIFSYARALDVIHLKQADAGVILN